MMSLGAAKMDEAAQKMFMNAIQTLTTMAHFCCSELFSTKNYC
jgi:hypothetical protein